MNPNVTVIYGHLGRLSNQELVSVINRTSGILIERERSRENMELGYVKHDWVAEIAEVGVRKNWQRAELIQRAKAFVENWSQNKRHWQYRSEKFPSGIQFHPDPAGRLSKTIDLQFIVNAEKRTVVALIHYAGRFQYKQGVRSRGIAKCMVGDVFNVWIGKAIALAKALDLAIPQEFLDSVQPDVKVVGMIVENPTNKYHYPGYVCVLQPDGIYEEGAGQCAVNSFFARGSTILDDTGAEYGTVP